MVPACAVVFAADCTDLAAACVGCDCLRRVSWRSWSRWTSLCPASTTGSCAGT